jgi:hypothetical protein
MRNSDPQYNLVGSFACHLQHLEGVTLRAELEGIIMLKDILWQTCLLQVLPFLPKKRRM